MKDLNNVKKQCPLSDRQRALLFCVSEVGTVAGLGQGSGTCPNPAAMSTPTAKSLCPASIFRSVLCGRHFIFFQKNLIKVTLVVIADKLHYVVNTVAC